MNLAAFLFFIVVAGVLFLIFYALRHDIPFKTIFNCKLFNFSMETKSTPKKQPSNR